MSIRDHLSDLRWRAANGRVKASNAWERAAGNRIRGARQQASNKQNAKTRERGKAPRRDGLAAGVKSRTPIYRERVNPATGRPHRDDQMMHRVRDEGLGKMKRSDDRAAAAEKFAREKGQEYRERKARETPARTRSPRPPLNHGAESRAEAAGREMYDPPARKPQGRTAR